MEALTQIWKASTTVAMIQHGTGLLAFALMHEAFLTGPVVIAATLGLPALLQLPVLARLRWRSGAAWIAYVTGFIASGSFVAWCLSSTHDIQAHTMILVAAVVLAVSAAICAMMAGIAQEREGDGELHSGLYFLAALPAGLGTLLGGLCIISLRLMSLRYQRRRPFVGIPAH